MEKMAEDKVSPEPGALAQEATSSNPQTDHSQNMVVESQERIYENNVIRLFAMTVPEVHWNTSESMDTKQNVPLQLIRTCGTDEKLIFRVATSNEICWQSDWPTIARIFVDRTNGLLRLPQPQDYNEIILTNCKIDDINELLHILYANSIEIFDSDDNDSQPPNGWVNGARMLSGGMIKGATKLGQIMNHSTPYLLSNISKQNAAENRPVGQNWQTVSVVTKNVTSGVASVTGFVAEKLGNCTMAVGSFLAPHIQTQGSKILSNATGLSEERASTAVENCLTATAGVVDVVTTVYQGAHTSMKIVGSSLGSNSERIIEHRYGPSAAQLAANTFESVGNLYTISQHTKLLTPKGLVKNAAKSTGKGIINEYRVPQ